MLIFNSMQRFFNNILWEKKLTKIKNKVSKMSVLELNCYLAEIIKRKYSIDKTSLKTDLEEILNILY